MAALIGVSTFRIGKRRRASWPLDAGSRAPPQPGRKPRLTMAPLRTCQDASTKASLTFNSAPTFPHINFRCGCLWSFRVYCLLKTQGLPPAPRQYGNGPSVLAQSDIIVDNPDT
jgi:hypothetical protein